MEISKQIIKNHPLKNLNTFRVGGSARYYFEAKDKETLILVLAWAEEKNIKTFILGGGSNVLIPDEGINGLVVHLKNTGRKVMGDRIECGAGTMLSQANSLAVSNSLSGLEWSCGIPRATIGGAVRGNAGAFGVCMSDIVENVEIFDRKSGRFDLLSKNMCKFGYRDSLFKQKDKYIIWKAILKLTPDNQEDIEKKIEHVLDFRLSKYPQLPSAGSVFENLNPIEVENSNNKLYNEVLKYKIGREGKIGAGLIIDMAGLKGKSIGGIKISLEHANHIVNTGHGTAEEVVMMISYIKQQVRDSLGIQLKEEIVYFGF